MTPDARRRETDGAEAEILELILGWAKAVRDEDFAEIRVRHAPDILMFDVPPPLFSQ